jgi:hypothetical protein
MAGAAKWQLTSRTLDAWFKQTALGPRQITVKLSHEFIRFAVVPWSGEILSSPERIIQARHRLRRVYGAASDAWTLSVEASRFGRSSLAAAMDTEFLRTLEESAQSRRIRLKVIEPWGAAAVREFLRDPAHELGALLVLMEGSKLVLLRYAAHCLQTCVVRKVTNTLTGAVATTIGQECIVASDGQPPPVFLCDWAHRTADGRYPTRAFPGPSELSTT